MIPLRPANDTAPGTPYNPQARVCIECDVRRFALFGVQAAAQGVAATRRLFRPVQP